MRTTGGVILCDSVAAAAHTGRFSTKRIQCPAFESRSHIRDAEVAPQTRVSLHLVAFQLIMHIEGGVVLLDVAMKAEHHAAGYPTATQRVGTGRRR